MVTRETSLRSALLASPALSTLPVGMLEASVPKLERFAESLRDVALPRGFLGPGEASRLAHRHILEAAALAPLIPGEGLLVDVGSGAGLPGIVLSLLRPGPTTLIESQGRRAAFLRETKTALGLAVEIVRERAEVAAHSTMRGSAAAVVARALAAPAVALELTLPFAKVGGVVLIPTGDPTSETPGPSSSWLSKSRRADGVAERVGDGLQGVSMQLGGGEIRVVGFEVPGAPQARWAMIVNKLSATPEGYPRRPGLPQRRPIGGGDVVEVN